MRDHILAIAEDLFYREGTRIGVDRIIAESKVAKATLYRHFPGKSDLVEAYLRARHERVVAALQQALSADGPSPRDQLLKIFDMLADKAAQPPFRGCAFLIAVAENETAQPVIAIAREHKAAVGALLERLAQALPVDAPELAARLALCYEGALASIAVQRDAEPARIARRCAAILIDDAIATASGTAAPG